MKFVVSVVKYVEVEAESRDEAVANAELLVPNGALYDVITSSDVDDWSVYYV